MTGVRISFKSFHKKEFNPSGVSVKRLSQSSLVGDRPRNEYERQKKSFTTVSNLSRDNARGMETVSHRDVSAKKPRDHSVIYNFQIRKLRNIDNKIQQ